MLRCSHAVDIQSSRYGLHKIIDASPHQILEHLNGRSRPPRPEPRFSRKTTHASHTIGPHPSDALVQKVSDATSATNIGFLANDML